MAKKIMFSDRYGLTEAVLRGLKTQTRRIAYDFRKHARNNVDKCVLYGKNNITYMDGDVQVLDELPKPRYQVGEVVAIAQSYKDCTDECIRNTGLDVTVKPHLAKAAGYNNKMFVRADLMPYQIRITNVRVEWLNDISESDCRAEGIDYVNGYSESYFFGFGVKTDKGWIKLGNTPREAYAVLIDRISGKGTWESNPYVFVYDFELVK